MIIKYLYEKYDIIFLLNRTYQNKYCLFHTLAFDKTLIIYEEKNVHTWNICILS